MTDTKDEIKELKLRLLASMTALRMMSVISKGIIGRRRIWFS